MKNSSLPVLNKCVDRLTTQMVTLQVELTRRETSQGTLHDVAKMNDLRLRIKSLEKRLLLAERLQESAASNGGQL